jgi:hypothetical protein
MYRSGRGLVNLSVSKIGNIAATNEYSSIIQHQLTIDAETIRILFEFCGMEHVLFYACIVEGWSMRPRRLSIEKSNG